MEDFSLIKKLNILMNLIISSPLFLFCFMMGIAILIFYIISIKKNKGINKWIFISVWVILFIILIINYRQVVFNLIDNLFDSIFTALYFPNLAVYIIILFISNFSFFYSIFSKRIDQSNKFINFITALLVDILLVLIIDIVSSNNINVYEELTVYSNSNLLVLLELTSAIFTSSILLNLLSSAHKKLKRYDKKEKSRMPEIIFEDV